jgi:hypothetical protein
MPSVNRARIKPAAAREKGNENAREREREREREKERRVNEGGVEQKELLISDLHPFSSSFILPYHLSLSLFLIYRRRGAYTWRNY